MIKVSPSTYVPAAKYTCTPSWRSCAAPVASVVTDEVYDPPSLRQRYTAVPIAPPVVISMVKMQFVGAVYVPDDPGSGPVPSTCTGCATRSEERRVGKECR